MKFSMETFIQQTNLLAVLTQEVKQKLLSTHSFMEQVMQKSEVSLEEAVGLVENLRANSLRIRQLLETYENELAWQVDEAIFTHWMGEGSKYAQNTRH